MDATFAGGTDGTTGLAATAGDAEVTLSWTDPSNSDLDRYQYRQGTGTTVTWGSWTNIGSSSATTTSHTVTGLTNGTEYAFQVRAVDGATNGADGETVRATPRFDPPAGLTATAGTTQVTLSWTNPSDNTISGYQYRQGQGSPLAWGMWTEIVGSGATTTSATVTGLTNGTQYSFEVRAVNGAASPTVTATPVVAPDAPTGLLAVPGVGRVTLYWTNPNNSDITGYQYQTRASGITYGIAIIAGSDASTTKGTAGSLGNGAAIDFRVRALAGAVEGAWSAWVSATPQSAVDATVQSLSPTSVSVVEGANAEMVVRLDRSVSADVQVYFSATDGTATKGADYPAGTLTGPEATTGLYRVTIPAGSTSATLSIATTDDTAYEGASAETFTVAITHIVSTAVIGEPTVKQFTVNLQDNDSAVVLSATSVTVAEPTGATTYTVRLPFQPSANVDVVVAPAVAGVVTVAPASLTFARNNWSTAQMVTVTAEDDDIDNAGDSRSVEVTHTPSSTDNRFQASRLRANVTDDDTRGYTFNPTALTMAEGGGGTYTVALNSQPTGNVTVTVTSSNADVTVDTDTGTDGNQNTLTFTTGDWETARTVTVSAAADADTTNDSATLTHTGVGADYGSISANTLTVTVTELATVDLSVSAASITEGASPLTLTATRSEANDSGSPIVIPIRVKADGTTAEPADYTLA
ncbi:MAG: fibronectin type III domain-containing protein, partial [Gammaproteobacteria bacterium]|nr:fibronectin type III domain-containing protein [Gammaproteobacteria bacterium]